MEPANSDVELLASSPPSPSYSLESDSDSGASSSSQASSSSSKSLIYRPIPAREWVDIYLPALPFMEDLGLGHHEFDHEAQTELVRKKSKKDNPFGPPFDETSLKSKDILANDQR